MDDETRLALAEVKIQLASLAVLVERIRIGGSATLDLVGALGERTKRIEEQLMSLESWVGVPDGQ